MKVCEKIKFVRQLKELSQEEMAEKLGLSLNGYTNIERGHADAPLSRIQQIADVFEMDLMELMGFGERNVVVFVGNENRNVFQHSNPSVELTHELEKAQLEITYLKEIIELMKSNQNQCA